MTSTENLFDYQAPGKRWPKYPTGRPPSTEDERKLEVFVAIRRGTVHNRHEPAKRFDP